MASTDLKQSCAGIIEMSKGWAKEIIDEFKPDLYRILRALGEKVEPDENNQGFENYITLCRDRAMERGHYDDYEKMVMLTMAVEVLKIVDAMDKFTSQWEEPGTVPHFIHDLGYYKGLGEAAVPGFWKPEIEKLLYSEIGRRYQTQRWERSRPARQETLNKIEEYAKEKYAGDYRRPHYDLATIIKRKPGFSHIGIKTIRKIVGEVAKPYGLKAGIPRPE